MKGMLTELGTVLHELQLFRIIPAILFGRVIAKTSLGTDQRDQFHSTLAFFSHFLLQNARSPRSDLNR